MNTEPHSFQSQASIFVLVFLICKGWAEDESMQLLGYFGFQDRGERTLNVAPDPGYLRRIPDLEHFKAGRVWGRASQGHEGALEHGLLMVSQDAHLRSANRAPQAKFLDD